MAHEVVAIDASAMPDVSRLVREVARTGQARVLRVDGVEAVLSPARPPGKPGSLTPKEREEILQATFGAWKGKVDADQLKRDLNDLQRDDEGPRSL